MKALKSELAKRLIRQGVRILGDRPVSFVVIHEYGGSDRLSFDPVPCNTESAVAAEVLKFIRRKDAYRLTIRVHDDISKAITPQEITKEK